MGESTKAVCGLLMIVGIIAAAMAWVDDRPGATTWAFRIGGIVLTLAALFAILKLHSRADLARDYLRETVGTYFNRDGFCFGVEAVADRGVAYMLAHFQNQRDVPSVGRIALRPARGFLLGREKIETITYEIECEPAAFGVARIPMPLPEKIQGKTQAFDVGASVSYPQGKGQRLRSFYGAFLRTNAKFSKGFTTAITVAGAAGGAIVMSKPATVKVELPRNVRERIPRQLIPEVKTLWTLGDPSLDRVA